MTTASCPLCSRWPGEWESKQTARQRIGETETGVEGVGKVAAKTADMIRCEMSENRLAYNDLGRMAELADAQDLKSCEGNPSCGFKSRSGY